MSTKKILYTGKPQPSDEESVRLGIAPYLPSKELVNAVNLAIYLEKRPLLIKGDPGSGKTKLAQAIAYELGLPLFAWYIKSTSQAKDGLYTYDAVRRLHDAQITKNSSNKPQNVKNINSYIKMGPLGLAFQSDKRSVILIDEIDKADIDFPNDLLLELDEQRFIIDETGEEVKAKLPPIVIVTSNDEKDLPDAFLRRCIFHYIEFPMPEKLMEIINSHFQESDQVIVKAAVERFTQLRKRMEEEKGKTEKKVSTSELLDWFAVLMRNPKDEVLSLLDGKLPYAEVLLKNWDDHLRYLNRE